MSDPAHDGYVCCNNLMGPVTLIELTEVMEADGIAAWFCEFCGVWRHGFPRSESQLRAIVSNQMPAFVHFMLEGK